MVKQKEAKTFEANVKAVLLEEKTENRISQLRIVQWIVDGKPGRPRIERWDGYIRNGETANGKSRIGLGFTDCEYVSAHWDEIKMFFS